MAGGASRFTHTKQVIMKNAVLIIVLAGWLHVGVAQAQSRGSVKKNTFSTKLEKNRHFRYKPNRGIHLWWRSWGRGYRDPWKKEEPLR
jgi:hypothetical protein